MPTPGIAANAYAQLSRITDAAAGFTSTVGDGKAANGDFSSMLRDAISGVAQAGHKSDTQARAAATGKANVVDVVTAVADAETAVTAMVAVRDNVIQAYQEVMRMAI
jgi:flagellar hook-basal body complex protein FliE